MKNIFTLFLTAVTTASLFLSGTSAFARTDIQQLAMEAKDGNRITGFLYQDERIEKDAPLAILMHGMTGSSLYWLADGNVTFGDDLANDLVNKGYRVVALDARAHGARKDGIKPLERLKALKSGNPKAYLAMINGTIRDYDVLLNKVTSKFGKPQHIMVVGYSMGAQMAVLFAAKHKEVTHLITMVPPAAKDASVVAPISHASKVKAQWLLLTASRDQFSTKADNDALAKAAGGKLTHAIFGSRHILPRAYLSAVSNWMVDIQPRK